MNIYKIYRITYLNTTTKKRETYLNNTGMDSVFADEEIIRLKDEQNHYEKIKCERTRKDFRKEQIKLLWQQQESG